MENKYYTPPIEDIRIGYECETRIAPYPNWVSTKIEDFDDMEFTWKTDWEIRTPFLTKEQIEKEGWKFDPEENGLNFVKGI